MKKRGLAIFEGKHIRRQWDEKNEKWWFSVVDIIQALTDNPNARSYWKVMKFRLKKEGSQVVTKCNQLKMKASDGKEYLTDTADSDDWINQRLKSIEIRKELTNEWEERGVKEGLEFAILTIEFSNYLPKERKRLSE